MEGWIKLHRGLLESNVWTCEPFSRGQAWVDLLLLANHKDSFFYKRGNKIEVKRGQLGRSIVELSDRWKWSRTKVNKFLKDLEKEQQVIQHKSHVTQVVTIINYDSYQEKEQQTSQQKNNRSATEVQQKDTYKNDNNDNNDNNEKNNISINSIEDKVDKVLNRFKETDYRQNERNFKTSKEELTNHLKRFLEIKKDSDEFKNKQYGGVITWFWNWCNSTSKPKEVSIKSSKPAPWLQTPKN